MPIMSSQKIFNEAEAGFAHCIAANSGANNTTTPLSVHVEHKEQEDQETFPGGFEGPEKKLDIRFCSKYTGKNSGPKSGLRSIGKEQWQSVLDSARCTIISSTSNQYLDSYVLSESSLFVYPRRVMIKTCGTTTLLHLIEKMTQLAKDTCGLEVEMLVFSRKNLNNPGKQIFPHCTFSDEVDYLNKIFNNAGHAYVMGPLNKDHWNCYIIDNRRSSTIRRTEQTFEVMMHDLDPQVMKQFFKRDGVSAWDTTVSSGISNLLPGSIIDDYQFDPCGYSMNGMLDKWYWTIHITPEDHCSYVSFDTNIALPSYHILLANILKVFRPGRFTAALYAEDGAPCGDPYFAFDSQLLEHAITNKTVHSFDGGIDPVRLSINNNFAVERYKDKKY
ncbi:S-adenosylmethionine decarboxylase [Cavenderia fasciculata]|uniref:S-adenosylmethionine decarboxylase proenzyme n=1 Tax=Cavenderia fasciculata TaxID=261658 RepID=F4Q065_CACFS|nr:S-adenosylmethionine decarboxylase [Cavenderia fasciculata]EGG18745.1 S-adenosylmethionine decarboxylase [Cavenderia fasciculata]|eukprot:XP_004357207.1 S-adenosylmethionine decarboxylase [Cavenderia fasciculata]